MEKTLTPQQPYSVFCFKYVFPSVCFQFQFLFCNSDAKNNELPKRQVLAQKANVQSTANLSLRYYMKFLFFDKSLIQLIGNVNVAFIKSETCRSVSLHNPLNLLPDVFPSVSLSLFISVQLTFCITPLFQRKLLARHRRNKNYSFKHLFRLVVVVT